MKKEYVMLMMLLVGFLFPMTIASKNLDFVTIEAMQNDSIVINTVEPLESGINCRDLDWGLVAVQNIRCSEVSVDAYALIDPHLFYAVDTLIEYGIDSKATYKMDSANELDENIYNGFTNAFNIYPDLGINLNFDITNYIRYL